MSMSRTKLEGYSYDSKGYIKYNLLYLLLNDFWDKSLDELPRDLRPRVELAVPRWDQLVHVHGIPKTRQQYVKYFDIERDLTQERETYKVLRKYILETLPYKIIQAENQGLASVVVLLRHKVEKPLGAIRSAVGIHWPNEYPLLWKAIYQFDKSIKVMRDKALDGVDYPLILALDDVIVDIYKILNIDRYRVESKVVADCESDKLEKNTTDVMFEKSNSVHSKNWILKIQAEASRRWKELEKCGCSPTRNNVKGDLVNWCKENNIKTDGGIFPSAEYIYRHVLRKSIWKSPS